MIVERCVHSDKVSVQCALLSAGVIGPPIFDNALGTTITVSRHMLSKYISRKIENNNLVDMRFQQDGAKSLITLANQAFQQ